MLCGAAVAADETTRDGEPTGLTYLLRYKFQPGEVIRWKVEHRAQVRSTVSGTTQTAETDSESIKVWKVLEVDDAGRATFEHSVESVDMRQLLTGRQEVRYNSQTDAVAPPGFEDVAKAVGVPLSVITVDDRGGIVKRKEVQTQPHATSAEITLPLPEKAVAVKETWSAPHDVEVRLKEGAVKQVKTRQQFTLEEVAGGIATVRVETVILTPIRDPALEAQLIQAATDGTVRFDIKAGRVSAQQTDLDKRVVGFQGETSSLHYVTRFTEELLPPRISSAHRPKTTAGAAASKDKAKDAAKPDATPAKKPDATAKKKPAAASSAAPGANTAKANSQPPKTSQPAKTNSPAPGSKTSVANRPAVVKPSTSTPPTRSPSTKASTGKPAATKPVPPAPPKPPETSNSEAAQGSPATDAKPTGDDGSD